MGYGIIRVKNNVMGHTVTRRKLQRNVVYVGRPKREVPYGVTDLGDRLFHARHEILGCSQETVADGAGISRNYYLTLEAGTNSGDSIEKMRAVAKAFGVGFAELVRYLDGDTTLAEFKASRGKKPRESFVKLSDRIGLPLDVVVTLAGESGGTMDEFKPNVRKAVLGLVHLLGYPLETVAKAAVDALGDRGDMGLEPEALASVIRSKLPPRPPSGTHPSSGKIKMTG